jgi:hypothetical protein
MRFIVARKENYVEGLLLRDLLVTKFIAVGEETSVVLQRYLCVIKFTNMLRGKFVVL